MVLILEVQFNSEAFSIFPSILVLILPRGVSYLPIGEN